MAWLVTISLRDHKAKVGFSRIWFQHYYLPEDYYNTDTDIENAVLELLPVIDDLTNGKIENVSISRQITLPSGLKSMATSSADVEEKGRFIFNTAYGTAKLEIPTFKDSLIVDGTDHVFQSDIDVNLFVYLLTDGSSTPLEFIRASDSRGDELISLKSAYERFKRSGKR